MNNEFSITHFYEPWYHFEIQNMLTPENFSLVKQYSESLEQYDSRSMYVIRDGEIYDILSSAMKRICKEINYNPPVDHEITIQFDNIVPNWAYNKIHSDNPKKFVTFIFAISDEGTGTHIYSTDKSELVKTTNWVQNGGNGFIRADDTWHDFDAKGLTDIRRTAIIMLAEKGWDRV